MGSGGNDQPGLRKLDYRKEKERNIYLEANRMFQIIIVTRKWLRIWDDGHRNTYIYYLRVKWNPGTPVIRPLFPFPKLPFSIEMNLTKRPPRY